MNTVFASFFVLEKDANQLPFYSLFEIDTYDNKSSGFFRYLSNGKVLQKHSDRLNLLHSFSIWNDVLKDDWSEISFRESLELLCNTIHTMIDYNGKISYIYPRKQALLMAKDFLSFFQTKEIYFYTDVKDCYDPFNNAGENTNYSDMMVSGFKSIFWVAFTKDYMVSVEKSWGFWSE